MLRARKDGSEGGEKVLAAAEINGMAANGWHHLALRFEGESITALVDGKPVLNASHDLYPAGMAGLLCGVHGNRFSTAYFDNVAITHPGERPPAPARPAAGQTPIYDARPAAR